MLFTKGALNNFKKYIDIFSCRIYGLRKYKKEIKDDKEL